MVHDIAPACITHVLDHSSQSISLSLSHHDLLRLPFTEIAGASGLTGHPEPALLQDESDKQHVSLPDIQGRGIYQQYKP